MSKDIKLDVWSPELMFVKNMPPEEVALEIKKLRVQNQEHEKTIFLLEKCLDDYCPQIGMTVSVRQYFYTILGHYPDWIEPPSNMAHFEKWRDNALSILDGN